MSKGRKSIPDEMKKAKGTDQPSRMSGRKSNEFTVLERFPHPPSQLNEHGRKIYKTIGKALYARNMLNEVNFDLFVPLCIELGEYYQLKEEISREGFIVQSFVKEDGEGLAVYEKKVNPKHKIAKDAHDRAMKIAVEFGLTPASLNRVAVPVIEEKDEFDNF